MLLEKVGEGFVGELLEGFAWKGLLHDVILCRAEIFGGIKDLLRCRDVTGLDALSDLMARRRQPAYAAMMTFRA